jgi:hypothetical protein
MLYRLLLLHLEASETDLKHVAAVLSRIWMKRANRRLISEGVSTLIPKEVGHGFSSGS